MHEWRSPVHYRLWLMGLNGRQRQRIINVCAVRMWDPLEMGAYLATENVRKIDSLQIKIPPIPWYAEMWLTIRWLWQIATSFLPIRRD